MSNKHPTCPGSASLTDDGKACKITMDTPLFCGLTADSVPGWPRCYNDSGRAITIPPAPSGSGNGGTGTGKKKLKPSCTDITNAQYENLLNSIGEIHSFEGKLFEDLEKVENGTETSMTSAEIKARIKDLSKIRNQLYDDLNNVLTSTQCNLADSRQNLADQIAMVEIVKKELDNSEKAIKELEIVRNNRRRMVEITNYEKNRYTSHKNIFKTIAFCGLGVLVSIFLINKGFTTLGRTGVVISIALGIILTLRTIYTNFKRSAMNWNRFDFGPYGNKDGSGEDTVYEHDVRAIKKLYGDTKSEFYDLESKAKEDGSKIYGAGKDLYGKAQSAGSAMMN